MASCDIQQLLTDGKCFAGLSANLQQAVLLQLWCDVAEALAAGPAANAAIQSTTDSLWYRLSADEIAPGEAVLGMAQVPVAAGPNAYLVLLNPDDGLKYKLLATGIPDNVTWALDDAPTAEAATPTIITVGANSYTLRVIDDGGVAPYLEAI